MWKGFEMFFKKVTDPGNMRRTECILIFIKKYCEMVIVVFSLVNDISSKKKILLLSPVGYRPMNE